jgi:hypothetical protein
LEKNFQNLQPDVRTIEKVGPTGAGKTLGDALLTTHAAMSLLSRAVGEGSATLREQTKVFTEKLSDHMIIAAKLADDIYSWEQLIEMIIKVYTKNIKNYYKDSQIEEMDELKDSLHRDFFESLGTNRNMEAQPRLLKPEDRTLIADNIVEYSIPFLIENLQGIYKEARNSLHEVDAKPRSRKLDEAISHRLQAAIDNEPKMLKGLKNSHENINEELKKHFFLYFREDQKSMDDYFYRVIDLNNTADCEDFIGALFSNNNLSNNGTLSIEVLCDELVIYAPMNKEVIQIANENYKVRKALQGIDLKLSVGVRDTRGLYHESADQQKENEYLQDLLYNRSYDALMIVSPIFGDTNNAKLREDIKAILKTYSKQTPIMLLSNKVDLLIDDQYKGEAVTDLFSMGSFEAPGEIEFHDLKSVIDQRLESVLEELKEARQKRVGGVFEAIPCYLKMPSSTRITRELLNAYGPRQALEKILKTLGESLEKVSDKIPYLLDTTVEEGKLPYRVDINKVRSIIAASFLSPQASKQLKAAKQNIEMNTGITPHGHGYNALGRRIPLGQGWTSIINQDYFFYCKSFEISFPANVQNLISEALLDDLLNSAVRFTKGKFKYPKDQERFKRIIRNNFRSSAFAANLINDHIFKSSDKWGISYHNRFNRFLKESLPFFNIQQSQIQQLVAGNQGADDAGIFDKYTEAMTKELKSAISQAFRLNVYLA